MGETAEFFVGLGTTVGAKADAVEGMRGAAGAGRVMENPPLALGGGVLIGSVFPLPLLPLPPLPAPPLFRSVEVEGIES